VVMRPRMAGSSPSLVLSSGEQEGGEGVVRAWATCQLRWRCIKHIMRVFSLSEDNEGEGVEPQEETKIGVEGRDMLQGVDR